MTLIQQEDFLLLTGYAKAVAKHLGRQELSTDLYVAGAWVARQCGELGAWPTLAAHVEAHDKAIQSLFREKGWNGLAAIAGPAVESVKVGEDLRAALNLAQQDEHALLKFLNIGIEEGQKLYNIGPTAYHEAGHAVISLVLRPEVRIGKASIAPEGDKMGYVSYFGIAGPTTREDFMESLCVSLAGQAAQVRKYGGDAADSGAISDIAGATRMAWQAITELGLDTAFGPVNLPALAEVIKDQAARVSGEGAKPVATFTGWLFDEAQRRLQVVMKEANARTEALLDEHWEKVDRLAQRLMEKKTMSEDEIRTCIGM